MFSLFAKNRYAYCIWPRKSQFAGCVSIKMSATCCPHGRTAPQHDLVWDSMTHHHVTPHVLFTGYKDGEGEGSEGGGGAAGHVLPPVLALVRPYTDCSGFTRFTDAICEVSRRKCGHCCCVI